MPIKNLQKYMPGLLLTAALLAGCKKFVQVAAPETLLSTETVFSNDRTALSALAGMYSRAMTVQGSFLNGGNTLYPALSADECTPAIATAAIQEFSNNALSSGNIYISTLYGWAYNAIYNANILLESLQNSRAVSPAARQQIMGEALFMRALIYSRLIELFGPVPLEITTNADINALTARSSLADVYSQVQNDLHIADSLLDTAYAAAPSGVVERTRPNKWAVRALSARVHLYRGEWVAAAADATAVISSGAYVLEASTDSVFLKGSQEAILQLQPVSNFINSAEGAYFLPQDNAQAKPAYILTSALLNAFQPGDLRRTHWVGIKTIGGASYAYPAKYKVHTGPPYKEYSMVIRLAEMILIRAEASVQQDQLQQAIRDLNTIRNRAHLSPLPDTLSQDEVWTAIIQERRIEFFAEWGHRWVDLKRMGIADAALSQQKTGWTEDDTLYPMPLTDMQRNPRLVQNPGY